MILSNNFEQKAFKKLKGLMNRFNAMNRRVTEQAIRTRYCKFCREEEGGEGDV